MIRRATSWLIPSLVLSSLRLPSGFDAGTIALGRLSSSFMVRPSKGCCLNDARRGKLRRQHYSVIVNTRSTVSWSDQGLREVSLPVERPSERGATAVRLDLLPRVGGYV